MTQRIVTQILGQSRALEILENALRSGRFHHAWIFSGPRGVGKFTAAIEVARVLLDPQSPRELNAQASRPHTTIQGLIDSHTHADLHIIRKEIARFSDNRDLREKKQMNIPIDLLRELVIGGKSGETYHEAAAYRTSRLGHGKVFVIDEAELLDAVGQNAMLKTLEEPPSDTYFFLITNQPDRLLPTIRSRCQHVRFQRLDSEAMREWLERAGTQSIAAKDLSWVLSFADGSPGVALLAIEFGFHQWRQTLDPMIADLERGKFPAAMGETLGGLVEEFAEAWVTKHGKKTTSKDAANKEGARHVLSLLAAHTRSKVAEAIGRGEDAANWIAVIDLVREAERQLDSNVNIKLLMENLVVQWSQAMTARTMA